IWLVLAPRTSLAFLVAGGGGSQPAVGTSRAHASTAWAYAFGTSRSDCRRTRPGNHLSSGRSRWTASRGEGSRDPWPQGKYPATGRTRFWRDSWLRSGGRGKSGNPRDSGKRLRRVGRERAAGCGFRKASLGP